MSGRIVMLCGGVGGARAALALYENLPPEELTFLVNTGDDFRHLGLEIWPDWDTVVYHLGGLQEAARGWGRADEGTRIMEELRKFPAPDWFHLGDRDIALHLYRTWALQESQSRLDISRNICRGFGIKSLVLPALEGGCQTSFLLANGDRMEFQDWFVRHQGRPEVTQVLTDKAENLPLAQGVEEALESAELVVFAPSNPYLSLGPMLSNPSLRKLLEGLTVPKLAVSPLIGGKAVKGPLDQLISSLSLHRGQEAIAHYWAPYADALLLPQDEIADLKNPPLPLLACPTLLKTESDRATFCGRLTDIWISRR